jgi:hypothetical protein
MSIRIFLCLLSLMIGLLQGCPRPTTIEIYNNSGRPVVILVVSGERVWLPGELLSLPQGSDSLVWRQIGDYRVPYLRLMIDGSEVAFQMNYLLPPTWQNGTRLRLQLNSDSKLYAVPASDLFPAKKAIRRGRTLQFVIRFTYGGGTRFWRWSSSSAICKV